MENCLNKKRKNEDNYYIKRKKICINDNVEYVVNQFETSININDKKYNINDLNKKIISIDSNLRIILGKLNNIENRIKSLEKNIDIYGDKSLQNFLELKNNFLNNSSNINFFDYAVT